MEISALVEHRSGEHAATVATNGSEQPVAIPGKSLGFGSAVNGGELLFLALATCYCNDLYREAKKRGIEIERVRVEVRGEFGGEGQAARDVTYQAQVTAKASQQEILDLMRHTDTVAEIHNTLRAGSPVVLTGCEARSV